MSSEEYLSLCPKAIITSKPKRESWAYEELWDTLFEIDPNLKVVRSKFKGVYLVYLSSNPLEIYNSFTRYTHAFISTVVPSLLCKNVNELKGEISSLIACVRSFFGFKSVYLKLRGRSKVLQEYLPEGLRVVDIPRDLEKTFVLEGIEDIIILSIGEFRSCGPGCHVLRPYEVLPSCISY